MKDVGVLGIGFVLSQDERRTNTPSWNLKFPNLMDESAGIVSPSNPCLISRSRALSVELDQVQYVESYSTPDCGREHVSCAGGLTDMGLDVAGKE